VLSGVLCLLGSISKRGNRHLRALFVQAAWVDRPKQRRTRSELSAPLMRLKLVAKLRYEFPVLGRPSLVHACTKTD
jgi:transposase